VIGRIAGNEFIEQCWSDIGIEARDKACAWPDKVGLYVLKVGSTVSPKRIRHDGRPRIVNVTERQTIVVGQVVIDAN